ncbi:MAG: hypothetical protein HUK15_04330 [Bacteroidales bacterium]|nr:hypothetical protein [Bacteroidales bacterium]
MLKIFLLALCIIAVCFVAIGVQVFFSKKKKFPETEIGSNAEMRKRNIKCSRCEEFEKCNLKAAKDCSNSCHNADDSQAED